MIGGILPRESFKKSFGLGDDPNTYAVRAFLGLLSAYEDHTLISYTGPRTSQDG